MNNKLEQISKSMIERYSKRYNEMGYDVKTLGWGNVEQQKYRFVEAISGVNITDKSILLDIGCGFGDLLTTIHECGINPLTYNGWDINPNLITEAQHRWANSKTQTHFEVADLTKEINKTNIADIGFMLGVLNLNFGENYNNYEYSKSIMRRAFECVNEVLVVDFLSSNLATEYPKEDFVFYHDPLIMLEYAFKLTPNVVLKHNYAPIPQKEFMLYLYK